MSVIVIIGAVWLNRVCEAVGIVSFAEVDNLGHKVIASHVNFIPDLCQCCGNMLAEDELDLLMGPEAIGCVIGIHQEEGVIIFVNEFGKEAVGGLQAHCDGECI